MRTSIIALAAMAFATTSCGTSNTNQNQEAPATETAAAETCPLKAIFDQALTLTELNGTELKSGVEEAASITLSADKISAFVGCNRIFATPTYGENGHVALEMGGATKMACAPDCREDEFLEAFNKVDRFEITEEGVNFFDCEGNVVFRATK